MKVADVMTSGPIAVRFDASLEDAANLMVDHRISGLPVVDEVGAVVGMITEGDLIRRAELGTAGQAPGWLSQFLAPGRAAEDCVRTHGVRICEVMTEEVISIAPDAPLSAVVQMMEDQHIKRLPVLEDGKLLGMVSRADLLRGLCLLLGRPRRIESVEATIGCGGRGRLRAQPRPVAARGTFLPPGERE